MLNTSEGTILENSTPDQEFIIPYYIRFWYFLTFDTLSVVLSVFTLYHLLSDRTLRSAMNNHIFIGLLLLGLVYESINIPFFLRNTYYSNPWSESTNFYLFWVFFDYSSYSLQIALFSWATLERHILIFHDSWLITRRQRFFIHYLPPILITVYYYTYYSIAYFGKPCETPFDVFLAGGMYIPCAYDRTPLLIWELSFHQLFPSFLIVTGCSTLVLRVIWQKNRVRQAVEWRKHRKMILQLLIVASIYIVFNIPWVVVIFNYAYGETPKNGRVGVIISKFLVYNIIFLCPLVCCSSLPELRRKFKQNLLCWSHRGQVGHIGTTAEHH